MSRLLWIAIAIGLLVALLRSIPRRPRDAGSNQKLDPRGLQGAPLDQITAAIRAGQKIEAIKLLRANSKLGLAEAKEAVEQIESNLARHGTIGNEPPIPVSIDPRSLPGVEAALAAGDTIEAIKLYRSQTGVGLEEAMEAIDAIRGRD